MSFEKGLPPGLTIGLVPVAIAPPGEMSGTREPMRASRPNGPLNSSGLPPSSAHTCPGEPFLQADPFDRTLLAVCWPVRSSEVVGSSGEHDGLDPLASAEANPFDHSHNGVGRTIHGPKRRPADI
jgi:hypothetical protein